MTSPHDAKAIEAALKHCTSEPVHTPGRIQPNGCMFAISDCDHHVDYITENSKHFLGVSHDLILGKALSDVFAPKTCTNLLNGKMVLQAGMESTDLGDVKFGGIAYNVTASRSGTHTIFELEPVQTPATASHTSLKELEVLLYQIRATTDRGDLFNTTTRLMQALTGYDRVMVYQFDEGGNGTVISETAEDGLDPYLGLRFPSWDIPRQVRALMMKTPLRCICDVDAIPAVVIEARPDLPDLDMTHSVLRGTSLVHNEYLRNMGSLGTLTLNIIHDGRLWGMIAMHHRKPRYSTPQMRQMCRTFAEFFTLKLKSFDQKGQLARMRHADDLRRHLRLAGSCGDAIFEVNLLSELSDVMEADGAALLNKGRILRVGCAPPQEAIMSLLESEKAIEQITAIPDVAGQKPDLQDTLGPEIAGVLFAGLQADCRFVFFRKARDQTIDWAGAPEKHLDVLGGMARLHPRASFGMYRTIVKGKAIPWSPEQIRIAEELRCVLLASEHSELISDRNRQQSILVEELNHRVHTFLALIRSLSKQAPTDDGSVESHVTSTEARRLE